METPGANRVFRIPELLQLIVLELDSTCGLARMARVSHAAHLAFIQTLWSGNFPHMDLEVDLFSHMMQLLPEGLMQWKDAESEWSFSRSPFTSDWTRFRYYSIHAKALEITISDYSPNIFSFFNDAKPNLFPRLHKIHLFDDINFACVDRTMLTVPTLRDLVLGFNSCSAMPSLDNLASFCRQLSRCTPQLRRLALPHTGTHEVTSEEGERAPNILTALKSLAELTKLSWSWDCQLSTTVVEFLATHPRLTDVRLGLIEHRVGKLGPKETLFPCLTDLELTGTDVGMESVLEQLPHLKSMTHIDLCYTQLPSSTIPLALSSLSQAVSLTRIFLRFTSNNMPWLDLEFDRLSPILSCKKMTNFGLSSTPRVEGLDDDAICLMAESWPELEDIFIFAGESEEEEDPYLRLSFFSLSALANSCPRLRCVKLSVMLTCCEYYDAIGDDEGAGHDNSRTLESLDLFYSRWGSNWSCKQHTHPQATAKILRHIWPSLKARDVHMDLRSSLQSRRLLFERVQQVKQCLAHMDQEQAIAQRDSVISSLEGQKNELEAECARLRHELADAKGGFTSRG